MLELLLTSYPRPTSLDELVRQTRDDIGTRDAVADLIGSGLVYEADGLYWVTKTAWRFAELQGHAS